MRRPQTAIERDAAAELRAENARLRAAVEDAADLLEDAFRQGAHEVTAESGLLADLIGWFDTASLSAWRDVGEWLVQHAGWERHPGGSGRRQFYRPPQEESEQ